uniref:Beta-kafirin n=2 Tax=Sorghum bicolor TaxID=4558 RepID=D5L0X8_SORBI|nr:beta-kafirin [Sorghum bicolor]
MKMVIVLAVCLALSAASASALQMPGMGLQDLYGAGALMTMMGAGGGLYPCAEYLRQPQCSPVAAPFYALREQTMWQPNFICQPLRQQCCQQMRMMDMQSRCQAMCGVVQSVVQQLQMTMQLQGVAAAASSLLYQPALVQQWQQLLPAAQALTPLAMAVAQVAQNMPAMCGLYQLPSYCTTPCATSAAIPPYYY